MIQISRILCPVDFSDQSRQALGYAAAAARWYGAPVTVLHVHAVSSALLPMDPVGGSASYAALPLSEAERAAVRRAIEAFVAGQPASGERFEPLVEEALNVPSAIVAKAADLGAGLIVMGTHGRSGFNRLVLGSVTEKVLRTAPCPVLCVPPEAGPAPGESSPTAIVCPTDFSPLSARTIRYAASIARQARVPLTVVHVVETGVDAAEVLVPEGDAFRAARVERARSAMASALAPEVRQAADVTDVVVTGKPYREILRIAEERKAGLIVIGVHGRGAVDRMFFGSTTQHVVRQARCPVLTVREQETR